MDLYAYRPYERVAYTVGMSVSRVRGIVNDTTTSSPTPPLPSTPAVSDNFTVGAIRRHIHKKFSEKQHFTLRVISADLKTAGIIPEDTSETTVWRIIHTMGFQYRLSLRKMYEEGIAGRGVSSDWRSPLSTAPPRGGEEGGVCG